jgi:PhzF family phenazine biosynthesis protein
MPTRKIIYQVDAFTSKPFKGNPAGVCILEKEMPDEWMKNIAAEMNLSETAFITGGINEYRIRFFTPTSEVPLCGHATLASAHIMFETNIIKKNETITFSSKAGILKTRYSDGWIIMNFPAYDLVAAEIPQDLCNYNVITPLEYYRTAHGWSFLLFRNEEEVLNLSPDFKSLKNSEYGDMIVTAPSSDPQYDFCVRCFAPALGIDEDPVTGSAHCALVPFWNGKTGKNEFISHQVSKRGGILKVSLHGDRVVIAGEAVTILRAELLI